MNSSATRSIDSGVSSAGLTTTVQPQANAGAIFHMPIISGKFHGTMAATTPTGSRIGIGQRIGTRRYHLPGDLVAPAGVVAHGVDNRGHVLAADGRKRLAGVQTLDLDQFLSDALPEALPLVARCGRVRRRAARPKPLKPRARN